MKLIPYALTRFFCSIGELGSPVMYLLALLAIAFVDLQASFVLALPFVLLELVCAGIKLAWHRPRPRPRRYDPANGSLLEKYHAGSFPSSHAARIMVVALLIIRLFPLGWVYALSSLVTLAVGYSRVFRKRHYWSDVIGGWVVGAAVGVVYTPLFL